MESRHIVKSYDQELSTLKDSVLELCTLVAKQMTRALQTLSNRDRIAGLEIIEEDQIIDDAEQNIVNLTIQMLALRQPVGIDLRMILAAQKIASDLERIGDHATNIAKRALSILTQLPPLLVDDVDRLGKKVLEIFADTTEAFKHNDVEKALELWRKDEEVDDRYSKIFDSILKHMMKNPDQVSACTQLIFIAKNIERVGDHTNNIAESTRFIATGSLPREIRPKGSIAQFVAENIADTEDSE